MSLAFDFAKSLPEGASPASGLESLPDVPPRLLIVDDISDNRAILARRFERRGYSITEAGCGSEALRLIEEQEFDLVLLDIMMPDIDGVEVLRRIRQTHSSASLGVIMVTARVTSEDMVEALKVGADDYITKPVDFAVAIARVNTQLARRRAEQQVLRAAEVIHRTNQILEQRVNERTAELVKINEQLRIEISQRERSEAETKHLAHHDALTGLANRVLYRQELKEAAARIRPGERELAILFIDLDGFKAVNDTLGHPVGDALICEIAARLKRECRAGSVIARFGGDEFAILQLSDDQPHAAIRLADNIVRVVSAVAYIQGNEITVGASIGLATCSDPRVDLDELMRNADLAMYRAKADGRGTWRIYDPEMDAMAQARRQLEIDLRRAIMVGDFRVYFQPIINLTTRKVVSFEALLRWDHATRGIVSPEEFIPLAEETGLIVPLGEWAIREACKHAVTWPEDIRVAVNLSPIQFTRDNIVSTIVSALGATGLRPDRLEVEITESMLIEHTEKTLAFIAQLRTIGVRVSIDDFGSGYSSLGYLRNMRLDKIKIDRSFVTDIISDKESRAIVGTIVSLGGTLGLTTTVEGIETADQLRIVTREGCSEVQGRLFSMPVPANEVIPLLEKLSDREIQTLVA